MNILQLCIRVPYPPVDGGSIAMYNMQKALHENNAKLKVLTFNTIKQPVDIEKLDKAYLDMTKIEGVYLDNRIKPFAALFNLFTGESYHIIRFIRRDFEEKLIEILKKEKFDVIQLESLYMIPYIETIRSYSDAFVVLRTHNIEHLIWQRLAANAKNLLRKWYLNLLAERLQHYEMWALNRVDAIVALTKEDHESMVKLGAEIPINISPIGIDIKDYNVVENTEEPVIFHLGAMDWMPNQEGIKWFLENVWPAIKLEYPTVKLKFAGKKMPEEFFKYADPQCEVNDFVDDRMKYMQSGSIMVVPLFSGSGMRVKIIEGLALGKAIVTTTVGLEGIPAINQKDVLVADNAAQFIESLRDLLNHPNRIKELGANARLLAETHFDNPGIGKRLLNFYSELISENSK